MDLKPQKRQRLDENSPPLEANGNETDDGLDTDTKIAILLSLRPTIGTEQALDILVSNNGSLEESMRDMERSGSSTVRLPKKQKVAITQSAISTFIPGFKSQQVRPPPKGKTLHLYTADSIASLTPATLLPSFLPAQDAEDLLRELLDEAKTFDNPGKFRLFERTVSSPHTFCLFVRDAQEKQRAESENGGWFYRGGRAPEVRPYTATMNRVLQTLEDTVNREIHKYWCRKENVDHENPEECLLEVPGVSPERWIANAAFINCYDGPNQSVGYHTDQLTYLGPMTTIASLSLGVTREFRVKRLGGHTKEEFRNRRMDCRERVTDEPESVDVGESIKDAEDNGGDGPIGIHLPHNSLLIMHGGMQEGWKHSVHPSSSSDHHPISENKRINITFRHYRRSLAPELTPRCKCGMPTVLRCIMSREKANCGRYWWSCQKGSHAESTDDGCGFFLWSNFDNNGEPIWDGWDGLDGSASEAGKAEERKVTPRPLAAEAVESSGST
ncbi:hypothetical protein BJ508DRAFT_417284 [Ascobolus immersus RN42]|uniref:Uncharacterized protein n=1 Tax=Ascobolus immersus RN42 TaxID=1160509 RepID=A0A3N4HTR6_ASCIM|nr:hypothetical protein BJ508DRAFT_417284 [Ascobolus immersus RN42]